MYSALKINKKEIVLVSFLIAVAISLFLPYIVLLIPLLIIIPFVKKYEIKNLVLIIISAYLIITSDLTDNGRMILNICGPFLLLLLYILKSGLSLQKFRELPGNFKSFVTIVFIAVFLSAVFSDYFTLSVKTVIQQLIFFLIVFLIYSYVENIKDVKNIIYTMFLVAFLVCLGILYQLYTLGFQIFMIESNSILRVSGIYNSPNAVGLLLAVVMPLVIPFCFKDFTGNNYNYYFILFLIFLSTALIITNSRSSMLSFLISAAYIFYYFNRKLFIKVLVTSLVLFLVLLFIPFFNDLLSLLFRTDRIFSNTRGFFWSVAFDIIKNNPVFGVGPGAFEEYIYKYLPVSLGGFFEKQMFWAKSGTAHNFFLFRTADLGILGFVTAVWLPIISIRLANKAITKYKEMNQELFYIVIAIKGTIVGLIARAFFESTGLLTHGWITRDLPFWLLIIILLYLNKNEIPKLQKSAL